VVTTTAGLAERQSVPTYDTSELIQLIRDRALDQGDRHYLQAAQSDRSLSFRQLFAAVQQWGRWIRTCGISEGDHVALAIADPIDFSVAFLACISHGYWALPLDPGAPRQAFEATVGRLSPSAVIGDVGRELGGPIDWLATPRFEDCRRGDPGDGAPGATIRPAPGGVVLMSSGSTGTPKAIELTEAQLLKTASAVAGHHRLTTVDVGFCPLPLFHVNAEVVGLLATLVAGGRLVLDDRFHRNGFWDVMAARKVTWINAVPAILAHLAQPRIEERIPEGIRFIRSASAPLPAATLEQFEAATGIPVLETYGMTEAASQITANPLDGVRKPGSVGLPVGIELRVVHDDPEAENEHGRDPRAGHIEIRGGPLTSQPWLEVGVDTPWLRTGDLGYLDDDGYLFLSGRRDDVINRGGEKMFPREIEEAILQVPRVAAAVVVPGEDPALGQVPVAYLTVRDDEGGWGTGEDLEALISQVVERSESVLPRPKRPVAFHVVEQFPLTPTGKVMRRLIPGAGLQTIATRECR
jgi:acyl-CoA synthetase (AMP-forming)/AMP-acid ligase II